MSTDGLLNIGHTGIVNLDSVSVEDFVQNVIFGKFFIKDFEKHAADVCGDILTVRWVVPGDVSVLFLILTSGYVEWRWMFEFKLMVIPTMIESFLVCRSGTVVCFLIT